MPGFTIGDAANGNEGKRNVAEFRRKHRWRLSATDGPITNQEFLYLKTAQRPSFEFTEAIVHHDQEEAYFAGKQKWTPIEVTFYDAVQGEGVSDISEKMYDWVKSVCDIPKASVHTPKEYKKTLQIQSTDASGKPDETWTLFGAWPIKSNWQDLQYESSEIQTVAITIKYDRAERDSGAR